jgi:hypothetical protein
VLRKLTHRVTFAAAVLCASVAAVQAAPAVIRSSAVIEASGAASVDNTSNLVFIGGISILRIHTAWVGRSPELRAQQVQERVNSVLSVGPVYPRDFTVGEVQGDWAVLFRGRRLFTADAATAKLENTPAQVLATEWAKYARQILPDLTRPTGVAK